MRSIIDAYHVRAVNTLNIIISLFAFLVASWFTYVFKGGHLALISAFVFSLCILGILTLLDIVKLLKTN
jgi:uncharacterized membrane protein YjjP (DUF1212 family)